jgi:hypothetical protein
MFLSTGSWKKYISCLKVTILMFFKTKENRKINIKNFLYLIKKGT